MTIIAWIALGLAAAIAAQTVLGATHSTVVNMLIGIVGALLGGWIASVVVDVDVMHGFFHMTSWITAIVGSLVLLLVGHAISHYAPNDVLRRQWGDWPPSQQDQG